MKSRNFKKVFSSFLVLTLIFTLMFPMYGAAANEEERNVRNHLSSETLQQMKKMISQHKANLKTGPVLHSDLKDLTGDEEVSVIVQLSEMPVAMIKGINKITGKSFTKAAEKSIQQRITAQQQTFVKQLAVKGVKAKVGFQYHNAFNGISMKVKASQVKDLLKLEGVTLIEPDLKVRALAERISHDTVSPMMNNSAPHLDIPAFWNLGSQGENVKVAVLDTGIDYNHPEFAGVYKGGFNFVAHDSGYARPRAATDPYETSPLDRPEGSPEVDEWGYTFNTDHGTHVAGIIAAQGNNTYGIKGIAPKIELYAYRVIGAYGSGLTSTIIAGIDRAVEQGMDIINLSVGGDFNSQTTADAIAVNNAVLAGTTVVVATGNSGSGRGTIGSPATAAFSIAVGNSTVPEQTMQGQVNVQVQVSGSDSESTPYNLNLLSWTFGSDPAQTLKDNYQIVAVPNWGVESDYTNLDVKGKVALVSRGGDIPYVEKIAAAKKAGAVAALIHNNGGANGNGPAGILIGDSFAYIPTFDMSTTDGTALRSALETNTATVTFTNFTSATTTGDELNDSSSRGPANPTFDIKPDVVAPGTNIMSTVPAYQKDIPDASYSEAYDRFSGTSMATPHVTAIAALLKSKNPTWTPFDIKVAISNTAKQLDKTKYDVFAQGPGLVQPLKAATAEALAYSKDTATFKGESHPYTKGTITFGDVAIGSAVTKEILVKNLTGTSSEYQVTVDVTVPNDSLEGTVTVDQQSFNLVNEQTLNVTLNVPAGIGSAVNEIQGYVHITNGTTQLSLPFAANFAQLTGLKDFSVDSLHISPNSPNGDGILDSTTVRYDFYDTQYFTLLELFDVLNPEAGPYEDGYLGFLVNEPSTPPGPKTVEFNGEYSPWEELTTTTANAQDGVYTLDLTTRDEDDLRFVVNDWQGPIFIKTTDPTIVTNDQYSVAGATYEFTGSVNDSYVNWLPGFIDYFGIGYNVNDYLHASYELTNSNNQLVDSDFIDLAQDGTFNLSLNGLTPGNNQLKIIADDEAGNSTERVITITNSEVPPSALTVNPNPVTLKEGENQQLTVTATEDNGDQDVTGQATYSSENTEVATVSTNGTITAVAVGTTNIVVNFGEQQATVSVMVTSAPPSALTVTPSPVPLQVGESQPLTVMATYNDFNRDVTGQAHYISENPEVATVSNNGTITAVAEGTTNIIVDFGEQQASVSVTVTAAPDPELPSALNVTPSPVPLQVGGSQQLTVMATYNDGNRDVTGDAIYSSDNTAVATVSNNGTIAAFAVGTANILVQFGGRDVTVSVTVNAAPGPVDPGPVNPGPVNPGPVTPPPTTTPGLPGKIVVNEQTGEITFEVDGKQFASIIDATKPVIELDLSTLFSKTDMVSTKVSAEILQTVAALKKNVVINTGTETIELPAELLAELALAQADNITFVIHKLAAKDVAEAKDQNVVTDVYDLNIVLDKGNQTSKFTSFKAPVKVTVSVKGKTFTDKRKAAAYYLNEMTGKWEYVGGHVLGDNFTFTTSHFSKFVVIENNKTFEDIQKHWAQDEIEVLASRDIIQGKEANLVFAPGESVTRGQFTILLARALNLSKGGYQGIFKDVTQNVDWAYPEIEAAYRAGIVKGKTADTFGINDKITREQMAIMLIRAIEYKNKSLLESVPATVIFKDEDKISAHAKEAVQKAQALNLVKGLDGIFEPKKDTSRAQAAVVLYRLLTLLKEI